MRGAVDRPRLSRQLGLFVTLATGEMDAVLRSAIGCLGDAGAEVDSWGQLHDHELLLHAHRVIMASEAADIHQSLGATRPRDYPPCIAELLHDGNEALATDYVRACKQRTRFGADTEGILKRVDCLVTPASIGAAPDPSTTGNPVFNSPWSLLGVPTVSFPIGLSAGGLPLAVQLIGRARFDLHLLRTAQWCETVIRSANRAS